MRSSASTASAAPASPPRVSVLLPVRDAGAFLAPCLDSLRAQTLREHEVVAVDDGSSDGSGEALVLRARSDPRALPRARRGARPPRRAHGRRRRGAPGAALAASRPAGDGRLGGRAGLPRPHSRRARHGARRGFDGPEDYDLWLRAFEAGLRFAKLPQTLLAWRDPPRRATRSDPRYAPARFLALKLEALLRGPAAGGRELVVWGAGPVGKAWSRALRSAGHPITAFAEVDPRKIGGRVHGAPVLGVDEAAARRGPLHLAAVGQKGARERIRAEAARRGLVEGVDLIAVA